jgi:hypothetical protein
LEVASRNRDVSLLGLKREINYYDAAVGKSIEPEVSRKINNTFMEAWA